MRYFVSSLFILCTIVVNGQKKHKGFQLIEAHSDMADYRIGNDWVKGNWRIAPEVEFDSLFITCHTAGEKFMFHTDVDSIGFSIDPGKVLQFYVLLKDSAYAMTVIKGVKPDFVPVHYDTIAKSSDLTFWYEQNLNNDYLNELRLKYPIELLVRGAKTDTEKAMNVLSWVHQQWEHNGDNEPKKSDAVSILEEVQQGKNFRCVEYGIVATACLNAVGLKSRVLALKTKNVETTEYGAGHVLFEVYLSDIGKWAVMDGQWDAVPMLNNIPLNAVEFQHAIATNYHGLEIKTSTEISKRHYVDWIYPYLYYLDVSFDNREGNKLERKNVKGKSSLMLVPVGAKKPTVFQFNNKLDYLIYTHSVKDFYAPPEVK